MTQLPKEQVLALYNRLVKKHGGKPIGERIFVRESGVSRYYWQGGLWSSWSALQAEAGHVPNSATDKIEDEVVLQGFAEVALDMGKIPSEADLMVRRRIDSSLPSKGTFRRWGGRDALLEKVRVFCELNDKYQRVAEMLSGSAEDNTEQRLKTKEVEGFVYLLRSGKSYKLGRTNATGRRLRELAIQLPQKPDTVHVIETDDPEGIEQYWHRRFAEKRQGGEWFSLSADDVKAFKRRRYQ